MAAIDRLLKLMVEQGASDFHLSSFVQPLFRLHGSMAAVEGSKELPDEMVQKLVYEIMPQTNREEFEEFNDTDFAYEIEGLSRFRVNIFRDHKGPGAVFRQIPSKILTVEQLNLPESVLKFCTLSKGLVVVTGPTGSGKSTTLAAMIDYINKTRAEHIITIEDPIEFVHPNYKCLINQRQVNRHTKSFKSALRAALREDPDIVLVGEMRDLETTEIALETAETGHLVFGTLHTNTAMNTVDRIVNQFPSDRQQPIRIMLASALKGVIAQTLCKKADGRGRAAALEILYSTSAVANSIRESKLHQIASVMQTGRRHGMQLLNDDLLRLVNEKVVTPEEALLKAVEKEDLVGRFRSAGIQLAVAARVAETQAKQA